MPKTKLDFQSIKRYFLGQKDIICVYLFGSCANNKQNRYSDVDLAVLVDSTINRDKYTDLQIKIMNDLAEELKSEVDVIILNRASPLLKFQIIKSGIKLSDKRRAFDRKFEAAALLEYFDFLPIKNFLENNMLRKIKEA